MGCNILSSRGLDYEWVVLLIKFIVIILFRRLMFILCYRVKYVIWGKEVVDVNRLIDIYKVY